MERNGYYGVEKESEYLIKPINTTQTPQKNTTITNEKRSVTIHPYLLEELQRTNIEKRNKNTN